MNTKVQKTYGFILLTIMISGLLLGCSLKSESIEISKDIEGYELSEFIDKEKDSILSALYKAKADPQFHTEINYLGTSIQSYVLLEIKRDLEFTETLLFANYPDTKKYVMSGYEEKLYLDHWPDEAEQEAIQGILGDMVDKYGDPWQKQGFFEGINLFDKYRISKYCQWEDGLISFTVDYDTEPKGTIIWIRNTNSQFYNDHYEDEHGMKRPYFKEDA